MHGKYARSCILRPATIVASGSRELVSGEGQGEVTDGTTGMADTMRPTSGVTPLVFDIEEGRGEAKQGIGQQADHHQPQDGMPQRKLFDSVEDAIRALTDPTGTGQGDQAENAIEDGTTEVADAHQCAELRRLATHVSSPLPLHGNGDMGRSFRMVLKLGYERPGHIRQFAVSFGCLRKAQ